MLRAVIIDDEANAIRSLELLIKKNLPDVSVIAGCNDPREAINVINLHRPDIVFLDINMPHLNGFEFLERLTDPDFQLIFTTAHREYALKAIKKAAVGYLLKPVDPEELVDAVERVKRLISEKSIDGSVVRLLREVWGLNAKKITLPCKNRIELVSPNDIMWIEASSNDCTVCLRGESITEVSRPLKEFESMLCGGTLSFMRVHNSYIINMEQVERFIREEPGTIIMRDKKKIPLSRQRRGEFLKFLHS